MKRASLRHLRFAAWTAMALHLASACGSEETAGAVLLGVDDGAAAGQATSALVSPQKATTLMLKSGAELSIDKDSVDKEIEVGMARPKDTEAVELVKSVNESDKLASAPYVLTPHGTMFKKAVELKLPIAKGADKDKLVFVWLADEKDKAWKTAGPAKVVQDKAAISLEHFSVLLLVEREGAGLDAGALERDAQVQPMQQDAGGQVGDAEVTAVVDSGVAPLVDAGRTFDDAAPPPCVSTFSCDATQAQCGSVIDNCGMSHELAIECLRACGPQDVCSANVCVCVPLTCAVVSPGCDPTFEDGCGTTIDCSACPAGAGGYAQDCIDGDEGPGESWYCGIPCTEDGDCPPDEDICTPQGDSAAVSYSCVGAISCETGAVLNDCMGTGCTDGVCNGL